MSDDDKPMTDSECSLYRLACIRTGNIDDPHEEILWLLAKLDDACACIEGGPTVEEWMAPEPPRPRPEHWPPRSDGPSAYIEDAMLLARDSCGMVDILQGLGAPMLYSEHPLLRQLPERPTMDNRIIDWDKDCLPVGDTQ